MAAAHIDHRPTLGRVRERRNAQRMVLQMLEEANASPAGPHWRERVVAALDQAAAMLATHVAETEGPDGFFDELIRHEPRVAQQVDVLRDEHVELQRVLADLIGRCTRAACPPADTRAAVLHLIGLLHQHRQAGADLLYEAYEVDVSVGD